MTVSVDVLSKGGGLPLDALKEDQQDFTERQVIRDVYTSDVRYKLHHSHFYGRGLTTREDPSNVLRRTKGLRRPWDTTVTRPCV